MDNDNAQNKYRIGVIGTGNFGGAFVRGLVSAGFDASSITVFDIDSAKVKVLVKDTGVNSADGIKTFLDMADLVVLAVKPNYMKDALESIRDAKSMCTAAKADKLYVTVAAGIHSDFCKKYLGENARIIRAMPNTPVLVKEGMTMLSVTAAVTEEDISIARKLFSAVGKVEIIDEKFMNDIIALTASSPAYVFMFIDALAEGAVLSGLPRELSYKLASQAVLGAAKMVLETGFSPGTLKNQVSTPGGTTMEAIKVFEESGFADIVVDAMKACSNKAEEISLRFRPEK